MITNDVTLREKAQQFARCGFARDTSVKDRTAFMNEARQALAAENDCEDAWEWFKLFVEAGTSDVEYVPAYAWSEGKGLHRVS